MSEPIRIESSDPIDDVEAPFRVQAGPGAGKTYWLVHHIRRVLKESARLGPGQKIACISYTNVAVEELEDDLYELGVRGDKVEVSTIHSFLYRNVVKPYVHLLTDDDGERLVNYTEMDGHIEHRASYPLIQAWLKHVGSSARIRSAPWCSRLETFQWKHDESGWQAEVRYSSGEQDRYIPTSNLDEYKKVYWSRGTIHHEDVLYPTLFTSPADRGVTLQHEH